MSKKLFSKVFILLLVVGLLFAATQTVQAQAATLDVCPSGCTYDTIQAAIDDAADGDTITVAAGSYNENVTVNKQLTIVGAGAESVTVNALVSTLPCFHITADGVSLSGFKVTGALDGQTDAILLDDADDCTISNNIATNNYWGITLYNAANNTISENVANSNTAQGIGLGGADTTGNQIVGNTASNNASNGILLSPGVGGNNTISGNTVSANGKYGISITSSNNTVTNNIITGNSPAFTNGGGLALFTHEGYTATGNVIQFNTITGNAGLGGIGSNSSGTNDISKNWWGSATGPTHVSNPGGSGDKLWTSRDISLLSYSPWLGMAPQEAYNGTVTGNFITSESGAVTGTLTGAYTLTVTGQVSEYENNVATFNGTVTGDIVGDITASINEMGVGTLAGTVTNTGAILPVRILGIFPQTGTKGDFIGEVITGEVPDLAESMSITTPDDVSTIYSGQTLQLGVLIDPTTAAYGQWSLWEPEGQTPTGSTITQDGLLTAGAPGTVVVIAKALDGSLLHATKTITILEPPTKLNMDPATIATTDTCASSYTVEVMVTDVTDLTAYHLEVGFDASKVQVTSVVNGGFLNATDAQLDPDNIIDNTNGLVIFGLAQTGTGGDPVPVDGSGSLITITFKPLVAGESTLAIDAANSLLVNWPDAQPIPFEVTGGSTFNFGSVVTNTSKSPMVSYCDLAVAVAQATSGDTLRVDANITLPATVTVDKALTLDLNGKVATASTGINALNVTTGGALIVNDSGTTGKITGGTRAVLVNGGGSLTLNKGTLEGTGFDGVFVYGEGSSVTVYGGTITGLYYGISGNGSGEYAGETAITINGGTVQGGETAIFHPEEGLLKITAGDIIGGSYNGIEMKAGDLEITGGTITTSAAFVANPAQTSNGNTQSGDAIFIYNRNGYGAGQTMDVTITGGTITSTNGYALREYTFTGETSRLGVATVSGGSFTGGTPGAVTFSTNNATSLELTGGDYSANPGAFVYTPYFTYLSGSRWYIAIPPAITGTAPDYYLVGEAGASTITITNPPLGAPYGNTIVFDLTIANAGLADITSMTCTYAGIPLDIKALLVDTGTDLTARLVGADGFFEVNPGFNMTMDCSMTFATAKTYTFTSEMVHKVGTTEYTVATNTATVNVYDKPTITFQLLDKYFLTGDPQNFQVTFDNPITGGTYGHVAFQISIPAAAGDITSLKYGDTALALDCTTATGFCTTTFDFGYAGGISLAPSQGSPWLLELTAAKADTYPMTFTLVDLDSDPDRPLQSAIGTATVHNKPVITAPLLSGPFNAGVPATVTVNVNNVDLMFTPNAFNLYFTFPEGTVYEYNGVSYTCTFDEDLGYVVCPPIPVTLVAGANALPITVTFPGSYNALIGVGLWDPMADLLAEYTTPANVVVNSGFTVTGNFSMQGNLSRADVPVTFTWGGTLVPYGPTGYSTAVSGTNFSQVLTYGGSYTITTNQPRYLNVYVGAGFSKMITVTGDRLLPELRLKAGNAVWLLGDNIIDSLDASQVGTDWTKTFPVQNLTINCGDVNFDGKVNIQDLALVGGNMDLTSAVAYDAWLK